MKIFPILCLTNLALANSYGILRRGYPLRELPSRGGIPVGAGVNTRGIALRRVNTKATSDSGKDAAKRRANLPKPSASVYSKGPAKIYHVNEQGETMHRDVPDGERSSRASRHPKRPQAGGVVEGPPSGDESLKVSVEGKYALIKSEAGPGGSVHYKGVDKDGTHEGKLKGGEEMMAKAYNEKGGAKAEVIVSRPGAATAIGINSPADLDPDVPEKTSEKKKP